MTELLTPTIKEVAALMCGVADDNPWKRGKRSFMVTNRDIFGIKLMVRHKHEIMAINTATWRIAISMVHGTSARQLVSDDSVIVKLPIKGPDPREMKRMLTRYNRRGRSLTPVNQDPPPTQIVDRLVSKEMVFDVTDKDQFERDWTLLRLFSTEWAQYAA